MSDEKENTPQRHRQTQLFSNRYRFIRNYHWVGALRKAAWLADRANGLVPTRMDLAVRVLCSRRGDREARAAGEQQKVFSESCGTYLDYHFLGTTMQCLISCRLEGESSVVFPAGIQAHLGCASGRAANEYNIATRPCLGSNQAHRDAETPPAASDPEMGASSRAENNRKRGNLPGDLDSSAGHASAAKTRSRQEAQTGLPRNTAHPRRARQ